MPTGLAKQIYIDRSRELGTESLTKKSGDSFIRKFGADAPKHLGD